ncbi:putative transporter [Vibrio sp. TH_r3]|uniref:putative transporter n=1 Tax=Vibrio sp. TH_r3 TaxID=3082084 RepID=UPI002953CD0C|nr:putative transporter [Vibrio sp. TH_r3]MDV7103514.1 putative transporter [Vibrio sp. TH_r3]
MSEIALSISILSLVAVLGLWIGNWKIRGVGLGIGGVLFGGIFVGHFAQSLNVSLDSHTLHFIQEFGLILFVYTIGIQVGPGFFASLRSSGLRLNGFAALIVLLGGIVTVIIFKLFDVPLPVILGVFSGAVTNTPSLGAGQQILGELGVTEHMLGMTGMGYAVAYPFGICGILLTMYLLRVVFKVDLEQEAQEFDASSGQKKDGLLSKNVSVKNANLIGLKLSEIPALTSDDVICSRLKRGEELIVPREDTRVDLNDFLHLVGSKKALKNAVLVIGEEVNANLSTKGTDMRSQRLVVTNEKVLGKKINELGLKEKYDVVVSRLNRSGVELVPSGDSHLQFGDILNLVGRKESIESVASIVGNVRQKLNQVQMLPIFLGIGLGVLLGSIPIYLPGLPAAIKLGLAGGPLIVALVLARIGSIGKLYWFMPPSANLALREIGIVLFLAVVGLKSGGGFVDTLVDGDGLSWMCYGIAITFIPLMTVGVIARMFGQLNYLTICGMLAGSMTDPPALAFANGLHSTSGASALSYATVYPLVMCLRILLPQLLAILLWVG